MFLKRGYTVSSAALLAIAFGGCAPHGPGGVAYESSGAAQGSGATSEAAGGYVSESAPAATEKAPRGNTPPGFDREGHGPAAGAIVDPSGVVTGGPKP